MGFVDKMLTAMNLNDDEYEYEDEYDDEYEDEYEEESRSGFFLRRTGTDDVDEDEMSDRSRRAPAKSHPAERPKLTPMRGGKHAGSMEVCVIKPASFEDARDVSETLLANRTIILNMEGLDLSMAQRIIDFVSGSCYAINGNLQKISNYIIIVTPQAVDISGDLQGLMDSLDFSGIQTGF